jgi:hypothetical protein
MASATPPPASAAAPAPALPLSVDRRPSSVTTAAVLLLISTVTSAAMVINLIFNYHRAATPQLLMRNFGFDILWILFVVGLWQRQNWARFAIVVLIVWGVGNLAYNMIRVMSSGYGITAFAVPILLAAIHAVAAVLIFSPTSNAWFKR